MLQAAGLLTTRAQLIREPLTKGGAACRLPA